MLYFRNTYKTCKLMVLYMILSFLSLIFATISLLFAFMPEFRVISITMCAIFTILFITNFFLLIMKKNNYKLKYFFKLGLFNKEFNEFKKLYKGDPNRIKEVRKQQKDYFLQFGETDFSVQAFESENNVWNNWLKEASSFNYSNAKYMEKLSYLTLILYNSCAGGGGLEEFFKNVFYEPFTKQEMMDIITKSNFYLKEFRNFLIKHIKEYDKEKEDSLFTRYELEDNKTFFEYEDEIFNYANWLAHNRFILSSVVGIYLHGKINLNMYRLFLSNDYKKIIYIYSADDKLYKVNYKVWDEYDANWNLMQDSNTSIYDSVETAYNDIKNMLKDYIEIEI